MHIITPYKLLSITIKIVGTGTTQCAPYLSRVVSICLIKENLLEMFNCLVIFIGYNLETALTVLMQS